MKARAILLPIATLFAAVCFAADVNVGTWKVNVAKSKNLTADEKNYTMVITADADNVKTTTDGTDAKGKPWHDEWTGKFDGKDYPVTGDPDTDMRAYKPVNDHTLVITAKKGGKIVESGRVVYSADGKTRTVTTIVNNTVGTKKKVTAVYDKQ